MRKDKAGSGEREKDRPSEMEGVIILRRLPVLWPDGSFWQERFWMQHDRCNTTHDPISPLRRTTNVFFCVGVCFFFGRMVERVGGGSSKRWLQASDDIQECPARAFRPAHSADKAPRRLPLASECI